MSKRANRAACLVLALVIAASPGVAAPSCLELRPEAGTSGLVRDFAWGLDQDIEREPVLVYHETVLSSSEIYAFYRKCNRSLTAPGDNYIRHQAVIRRVPDALFVRANGGVPPFVYYSTLELLGFAEAGRGSIDLPDHGFSRAKELSDGFVEVTFEKQRRLVPVADEAQRTRIPASVLVVASVHALSLAPLAAWEKGWGDEAIDRHIELKVVWLPITEDGEVASPVESNRLEVFADRAKKNRRQVEQLDNKPVAERLAAALAGFPVADLDYLVLLKDSWDISTRGLDELDERLAGLATGVSFDVLSTPTVTASRSFFEGLTARHGGRYFESADDDRLEIKDASLGARMRGKVRARARERADRLGLNVLTGPVGVDSLIVRMDEPYFEVGNLITSSDLERLIHTLRLVLCLADGRDAGAVAVGLHAGLGRGALIWTEGEPLRQLVHRWFRGFVLPSNSPLARVTLEELVLQVSRGESRAYLEQVIVALVAQRSPGACALFVPSSVFRAADADAR